jgi:alpha-tubulin suppressor-like RCC1 family protein
MKLLSNKMLMAFKNKCL